MSVAQPEEHRGASPFSRRALLVLPALVAGGAGLGFFAMLRGLGTGGYDPRGVPSALIGKAPPEFALPPLEGTGLPGLSSDDLKAPGRPVLVNFFASWCVPCVIEHPQLMRLSREGVPVFGVGYKDQPADSRRFLEKHGNPYKRLGMDLPGRASIDWGLYGVPETYLIDRGGAIRWRWAGPVTDDTLRAELGPLLRRYA
ncbi:DsbE family thiol:disulfide interchange protein [Craurococcus roseus]|uniref:DsbE family thiol:disulfide interchange protein n=1 Tax=Craurococcus roseus TaxID=77585 RepID=A0ABP3QG82_9PROT